MSTLVYSALTTKREEAEPRLSTSTAPPGLRSYVDVLVALVPAEVLAVHAAILPLTTETGKSPAGDNVTTVTEPATLEWSFAALVVLSVGLYVAGRRSHWERLDFARMLIPALAFVCWTMLQKASAFDAIAPDLEDAPRYAIAVLGAVVLAAIVNLLSAIADEKPPR